MISELRQFDFRYARLCFFASEVDLDENRQRNAALFFTDTLEPLGEFDRVDGLNDVK